MTHKLRILALLLLFLPQSICAQSPPADARFQSVLARLDSLVNAPLDGWRFHADLAHPEDASLDDSSWPQLKIAEKWTDGPRVLRRWIETPAALNGYSLQGAQIRLDLQIVSEDFMTIAVFSNGSMAFRGDEDAQQPILLTDNARPGQKFLIAVRVQAAEKNTQIRASRLLITPSPARPDPGIFRQEILVAQPMVAAFPESQPNHQAILAA